MTFEPVWHNGQLATSPCGGSNCLVWSSARAVERHTRGAIAANTGDIRRWISGTTCGGTTLAQVSAAVKALYGVELLVRYSLPWADFLTLIQAGRGAVVYIGYAPMHGSGFDSFPTFNGGHGVFVGEVDPTTGLVYDPGADGRRAGIPLGPQRWPLELLKKAAGAMPAGSGTVGYGFVSAAFTRDTEDEEVEMFPVVTQTPLAAPNPRLFTVRAGTTLRGYDPARPNVVALEQTFAAASSAHVTHRAAFRWVNGRPTLPDDDNKGLFGLVADGAYAGLYIFLPDVELEPEAPGDPAAFAAGKAEAKARARAVLLGAEAAIEAI